MAKQGGMGDYLYVHGANLSGDTNSVDTGSPRATTTATGIDSSAEERFLQRGDGRIGWRSFFNDAAEQAHPILSALPTTDIVCTYLRGSTRGNPAFGLVAKQVGYDPAKSADGSWLADVECLANGSPLEDLKQISAGEETLASSGSLTGLEENGGAGTTTAGAIGYLHLRELDSGTPTFLLEDSSDSTNGVDGSWATLISFGAVTTQQGIRSTVTGSVDDWIRLTATGTFVNADVVAAFRRGTAADDVDLS